MTIENPETILSPLKISQDDLDIIYEVELVDDQNSMHSNKIVDDKIKQVHERIVENEEHLVELNNQIDKLTNHADGIDYTVAVGSGVLAALIDIFYVGEFNLERARDVGGEKINNFVVKIAHLRGYEGDDLKGAIKYLEADYKLASDSNTNDFGGGPHHHLRDFAHHPNIVGLMFSVMTQFTERSYGIDGNGKFIIVSVGNKNYIGKNIAEKLIYGIIHWFFHMVSDIAGSGDYAGAGTGLPGPIVSLGKQLSVLPFFRNILNKDGEFSRFLADLFNGKYFNVKDADGKPIRFDFRTELGVAHELGRQAIPVIINEAFVRGFYFIRQFAQQVKDNNISCISELNRMDWRSTLPANNRTIVRMLTISTGVFTTIDIADGAIRAALKSKGNIAVFAPQMLLHVNFVGVGRFAVSIGTELVMEVKEEKLRNERLALLSEQLHLLNSKVYYHQADSWMAAETTAETIQEVYEQVEVASQLSQVRWGENLDSLRQIDSYKKGIDKHNETLVDDIMDVLKWG